MDARHAAQYHRNGSSKAPVLPNVRTLGDIIDLHDEDMRRHAVQINGLSDLHFLPFEPHQKCSSGGYALPLIS